MGHGIGFYHCLGPFYALMARMNTKNRKNDTSVYPAKKKEKLKIS